METNNIAERIMTAYERYKNENYSEAFQLFTALWDDGVYEAAIYLGDMYRRGLGAARNVDTARELYKEAASHGVELAQLRYAELSRSEGRYEDALQWYAKLAAAGNISAQYWLYVFYRDGKGVQADSQASTKYLEQAADGGHLYAMRDLSRRYLRGKYGTLGILKGIGMSLRGMTKFAFALANEPGSEKLR
jgi:TPR repeat protein